VAGVLLTLPANETDDLAFFCHQDPGRRKTSHAPALEGSITGSSVTKGKAKSLMGSGEGSTERKTERDLLMGMGNLTIRKNN
jgi:hypothetical protein